MSAKNSTLYKFVLVGDSGVGKSSLLFRFTENTFTDSFINTIGVDFRSRTLEIDNKTIKLQIWDTAGQERFRTITSTYYRGAQGIILVYDVTNYSTFENIQDWLHEVEKGTDENTLLLLIGNKCDLIENKNVTTQEAIEYAMSVNIGFMEASAKTSENVEAAFIKMTKELLVQDSQTDNKYLAVTKSVDQILEHRKNQQSNDSSCCVII